MLVYRCSNTAVMFQVGRLWCVANYKSVQFVVTWQGLLLRCCFNWRSSYFWSPFLLPETTAFHIVLLLWYYYLVKGDNITWVGRYIYLTTSHRYDRPFTRIHAELCNARNLSRGVLQRYIRNIFKFSSVPLLRLNFSWKK